LAVLILLIGSFLVNFERRHPRAREIVLLAVMISLTVTANEICAHTIPLHAGTALVLLSGIGLGPEAGMLIGAFSRFLCNFFDGQGPWTPWQMVAWGLLGYLAGSLFNKTVKKSKLESTTLAGRLSLQKEKTFCALTGPAVFLLIFLLAGYLSFLFFHEEGESFFGWRIYAFGLAGLLAGGLFQRKRLPADTITVTVFTFFSVLIIYGGMMNFAAMLFNTSYQTDALSLETLKALYITGFPYDISHAGFAALCVFLFGDSILQRLQRICTKFGILL
jgi:energy-coupling factor transport system substrate-specific component